MCLTFANGLLSPPVAAAYTHLDCRLNRRTRPPLVPPELGGDRSLKSPRIGGFRGAKPLEAVSQKLMYKP